MRGPSAWVNERATFPLLDGRLRLESPYGRSSEAQRSIAIDAVVDALVWGAERPVDLSAYEPQTRVRLERHRRRFETYRSMRAMPQRSSEREMVYRAQVRYERRLVAVTDEAYLASYPAGRSASTSRSSRPIAGCVRPVRSRETTGWRRS
jgi:hypothetical protein